jgi:hypothetical protein
LYTLQLPLWLVAGLKSSKIHSFSNIVPGNP